MKHPIFLALIAVLAMASLSQTASAEWRTYQNARFGFRMTYPADLFQPGRPPENGGGLSFASDDGQAKLSVWASFNSLDQTPRTYLNWLKQEIGVVDEATYERVKNNWMVISGYKGDMIYYEKTIFSCGSEVLSSISMSYPVDQRDRFDRLVGKITKSLKPGRCE